MDTQTKHPVRAGIFRTVEQADRAVRRLQDAGFEKDQLAVICSDETRAEFFPDLPTPRPSGSHTSKGVAVGGAIGMVAGGLAALVTGIPALVAAGAMGPFFGAMMTRGAEKETTDFYDQAVEHGSLLVSVEVHGEDADVRLKKAELILAEAGAEPISLAE